MTARDAMPRASVGMLTRVKPCQVRHKPRRQPRAPKVRRFRRGKTLPVLVIGFLDRATVDDGTDRRAQDCEDMNAMRAAVVSTLLVLSSCDGVAPPTAAPPVEYRPELAGTVDHAMCLLGFAAAPLRRLVTGHQVVEGTLNGKPATFVVDTGANVSVIHSGFSEQFGLTPERGVAGAAIGLGGGLQATRSRIESLRIGPVATRQNHLMIADLSQLERLLGRLAGAPIHGIVGQDLMNEHRAVIDAARPMLYLQPEDAEPAPVPAERCMATETQESSS